MKQIMCAAACICALLCAVSCRSAEPQARSLEGSVESEVLEHKGSSLGINQLPVWVETYIETGISGIERLTDYDGMYCFVGEASGTNLEAVRSWAESFDAAREIAAAVSSRVESLFSGAANGSPDGVYGTYFEDVVRTSASASYSGVRKTNDWWIRTRTYDADDADTYTDSYHAFVLYVVPKDVLNEQVAAVMNRVAQEDAAVLTADQLSAAENVRSIMENIGF